MLRNRTWQLKLTKKIASLSFLHQHPHTHTPCILPRRDFRLTFIVSLLVHIISQILWYIYFLAIFSFNKLFVTICNICISKHVSLCFDFLCNRFNEIEFIVIKHIFVIFLYFFSNSICTIDRNYSEYFLIFTPKFGNCGKETRLVYSILLDHGAIDF